MKKTLKQMVIFGLVLVLSLGSGVVYAKEDANILSQEFQAHLDTMKDTDTAQIAVYATGELPQLTQEEYEAKVIAIMGEENYRLALTGSPEYTEQINKLIALHRQFQQEAEQTFWDEAMKELALEKTDDMVIVGVSVTYRTTKAEILRLAQHQRVDCILWFQEEPVVPDVTGTDVTSTDVTGTDIGNGVTKFYTGDSAIYKYTAVSALHILRACVGKEEGSINSKYDVNADGDINAVDALWALQSAVGKRVVEWPLDKAFPE